MPRYFFHISDGRELVDDYGWELDDLDTARREATRFAGAILKDEAPVGIWSGDSWTMEVTHNPERGRGPILLSLTVTASTHVAG